MKKYASLFTGGSVVDSLHYLGHIISNTGDDRLDIMNRRNSPVAQINNVLCYFKILSIIVKIKLLMSYCGSYYGAKLWLWVTNQLMLFVLRGAMDGGERGE